jgi:hypothetical protein
MYEIFTTGIRIIKYRGFRAQIKTSLLELNLHKETGICNILAWLFNAKEGHLQGECFFKSTHLWGIL